jgi:hypothetical protein
MAKEYNLNNLCSYVPLSNDIRTVARISSDRLADSMLNVWIVTNRYAMKRAGGLGVEGYA